MTEDRDIWRNLRQEQILEPALPIIDPHHHLWPGTEHYQEGPYRLPELRADLETGHNIVATIYVDAYANYAEEGPPALRPVGETRYAAGVAAEAARIAMASRPCAGIVANIDLGLEDVATVLAAHEAAADGRLRGVRQLACSDPTYLQPGDVDPLIYDGLAFRRGFELLAERGLCFDACLFHYQIPQLIRLAQDFPSTTVVMDHLGSPLGIGPYAGRREAALAEWRSLVDEAASCPNIVVKVGGQGMYLGGYEFHGRAFPPSSDELVEAWGPLFEFAIDRFGPSRCMFESNFPVDGYSCSYPILWNAFKKFSRVYSTVERDALFFGTANSVYRLIP